MGLFSGSFGTGLITGLASSEDRSMRDAIDRRNSELSEARKYIQTRQAAKLDAAEAKKQKFNEETQLAFDALAKVLCGIILLSSRKNLTRRFYISKIRPVSYTHLTLPTIYSV